MKSNKIAQDNPRFPAGLKQLAQVPKAIFWRGEAPEGLLQKPRVAIVGSRKVSPYGRSVTEQLARELAGAGVVVVSGLAIGVDSIAHRSALQAGGQTIAVLPCGIDTIYPASHFGLAKDILQHNGSLLSEYDGNEKPMKHQFIARNRLIAGLSNGVIITEAAAKSGSLHTAEFALELGVDVFAIPGNITSANSEGTNNLLKQGAIPVTSADDVLTALHITPQHTSQPNNLPAEQVYLLKLIKNGVVETLSLQQRSGMSPATCSEALTLLELAGLIQITGGKIFLQ